MKIVANAVFFIDGDQDATEYQSEIVEYEGKLWFVANRILHLSTNTLIPAQLVPLSRLPHTSGADGPIRVGMLIPKELGSYPVSQTIRLAFEVADNPALTHIPGPISSH